MISSFDNPIKLQSDNINDVQRDVVLKLNDTNNVHNLIGAYIYVNDDEICDYYKQVESIKKVPLHDKKNYELSSNITFSIFPSTFLSFITNIRKN